LQRSEDPQPGPHSPLGIIFVGCGIAEVHQQPIPQMLGNVSVIALDHVGAGCLIGAYYLAQLFRIKLLGECGGAHQVTEHHGELATLGLGRSANNFPSATPSLWLLGFAPAALGAFGRLLGGLTGGRSLQAMGT
jgi:hypothetical protein